MDLETESSALPPEFAALGASLSDGLTTMALDVDPDQRHQMLAYLALLKRWNRAYNLTAVVEPREMVARHLLDSLSLTPWLRGETIVDSGTGAGLPGVPLAIIAPEKRFILIDGNGKKIRFLRQVRRSLELGNIEPIQARLPVRLEDVPQLPVPDLITARALAPLSQLLEWHRDWVDQGASLLAMKSRGVEKELFDLPPAYNVEIIELKVHGEVARRCLAIVTRK